MQILLFFDPFQKAGFLLAGGWDISYYCKMRGAALQCNAVIPTFRPNTSTPSVLVTCEWSDCTWRLPSQDLVLQDRAG